MKTAMALLGALFLLVGGLFPSAFPRPVPVSAANQRDKANEQLHGVMAAAQAHLLTLRQEGKYWNMPSYLGTYHVAQYYLLLHWLGRPPSALNEAHLRELLLHEQLPDGSWYAVTDANLCHGDLNATIVNYWALKVMGLDVAGAPLARARQYVLCHGGIERASTLTKIHLALFQNYTWHKLSPVPPLVFSDLSPINYKAVAQWVTPHLLPISYLRRLRLSKDLGPAYRLDELWCGPAPGTGPSGERCRNIKARLPSTRFTIHKILEYQQPRGSVGGYTLATQLAIVALTDYGQRVPCSAALTAPAVARAFAFMEERYFRNSSAYKGSVSDGRLWDSALAVLALRTAGYPAGDLQAGGQFIAAAQSANGGFPFGEDFDTAPDTDTTAEIILALAALDGFQSGIDRAVHWLLAMQNRDGGWGAFTKNNRYRAVIEILARQFEDSSSLFDESSSDVTGHILEALACQGLNQSNCAAVRRAIRYLQAAQDPHTGLWPGRWGVNYVYGTGAALVGLVKAGVDPGASLVQKAVAALLAKQNPDGGFGETTLSYRNTGYAAVGVSTPSQTAWALLALIETGQACSEPAEKAVRYLVEEWRRNGRWLDGSTVGTGHPCIVYIDYPIYPNVFPPIALARYRAACGFGNVGHVSNVPNRGTL